MQKTPNKHFTTISDVAKHAKVGKTSVSRYLNGEQNRLSEALRDKIALAIEELDFRPNHSARMLRAGHSNVIGLMFADVTNPYSIDVLKGIEQVCQREGYMLMVCNTDNEKTLQDNYLSILEAHRVDGIIMNIAGMETKQIENLSKLTSPVVLIDRVHMALEFDSVGLDNNSAVFEACEHLQAKAYDSILVVTESLVIEPRQARIDAIQQFAAQHTAIDFDIVEVDNMNSQANTNIIADFVSRNPNSKKAIFTTNGVATMMIAKVLKKLNIRVGSDIGLIGIDDPEWAQLFEGGITVMRQPTEDIGQTACNRLLSRIQGNTDAFQHIQLPAKLIVREST